MLDARYTQDMTVETGVKTPGRGMIRAGVIVAALSLFFVLAQFTEAADFAPLPWLTLLVGFGLVVVGYLQRIAAK